jgi:hypothetical protein
MSDIFTGKVTMMTVDNCSASEEGQVGGVFNDIFSEGGNGGSGFKASKVEVDAQRIKDNEESMRRFYAMWSSL